MSDARHRERKMPNTQVLWHLEKSLTKWTYQHVTKSDDALSQRHKKLGAEFFFQHLKDKEVNIEAHAYDRNLSITKFTRDDCESEI